MCICRNILVLIDFIIRGLLMTVNNIHDYIRPGQRAHLVGIGGVSMASLAEVLLGRGMAITGSDWKESATVLHLRGLGIQVFTGPQKAENIAGAACVIRTAAAHDDNPEIAAARHRQADSSSYPRVRRRCAQSAHVCS